MAARLRQFYQATVLPALTKEFGYKNVMAAPRLDKISVNIVCFPLRPAIILSASRPGLNPPVPHRRTPVPPRHAEAGSISRLCWEISGAARAVPQGGSLTVIATAKLMDGAVTELGQIAGQKPVVTKATKSIAAFKLREGMPIGCMVTLRGDRMYEFFDRLVNVALPRVRDFRGVSSKSFDGRGNYTLGVKDQLIFPEIDYSKVDKTKGMNVTITTTARTDAEGLALLKGMGMPFRQ